MRRRAVRTTLALAIVLVAAVSMAADWPQYLGPERNGIYRGTITGTFAAKGPRIVWSRPTGQGFAGPAVAGSRVLIFHRVRDEEVLEALDTASGTQRDSSGSSRNVST